MSDTSRGPDGLDAGRPAEAGSKPDPLVDQAKRQAARDAARARHRPPEARQHAARDAQAASQRAQQAEGRGQAASHS